MGAALLFIERLGMTGKPRTFMQIPAFQHFNLSGAISAPISPLNRALANIITQAELYLLLFPL